MKFNKNHEGQSELYTIRALRFCKRSLNIMIHILLATQQLVKLKRCPLLRHSFVVVEPIETWQHILPELLLQNGPAK